MTGSQSAQANAPTEEPPTATDVEAIAETTTIIRDMRAAVEDGQHWFGALMAAVRSWPLPVEEVGDRTYCYLVGGEAFDWLLLAERLCDEIADLVPEEEEEALLFEGRLPIEIDEPDFERLLGAKHKAHLNFVYGVRVEEALQLAVQGEVQKERFSTNVWENGHLDDDIFHRIYGATKACLLGEFRAELGLAEGETLSLAELREFTYWLFKNRMKNHDPARVASDTRKGLAQLQRLEARRAARRQPPTEL
jgi:hypothetical protein